MVAYDLGDLVDVGIGLDESLDDFVVTQAAGSDHGSETVVVLVPVCVRTCHAEMSALDRIERAREERARARAREREQEREGTRNIVETLQKELIDSIKVAAFGSDEEIVVGFCLVFRLLLLCLR